MLEGYVTALITPMRDGRVDEEALRAFVEWQITEGVNGLLPCGTTGESPTLSHDEHMQVTEMCIEVANGRVPVLAGTGSNSTEEAIALTRHAKDAGADIAGGDDFIEKIKGGDLNFDKLICTPSMMIKLSKLGKVLGPKGLMPNPKLGTVTNDIKKAVTDAKSGQVEIRNDKDGNIGVSIGKKSFKDEQIIKNYNAVVDVLEKEKSNNTIKGDLIKQAFITSTMGISYKLKIGKNI